MVCCPDDASASRGDAELKRPRGEERSSLPLLHGAGRGAAEGSLLRVHA